MHLTKRKYALISGFSLIAMAVAAGYAYGYVFGTLIVKGMPDETFVNLEASLPIFIGGIVGWGIIFLLDALAARGLHKFLKEINHLTSLITAMFRIMYAAVLAMAIVQLISIIPMIQEGSESSLVMDKLNSFESIWSKGLLIFGMHLFGLGILVVKSKNISNFFGILLLFAGFCYSVIHLAKALVPFNMDQIVQFEMILSLPMAIAEIGFAFWLICKGGKTKELQ